MLKNKIKLRSLKADDNALIFGFGATAIAILIILGIIGIFVLGSMIMNIAIGMVFIAIALLVIAFAAKMIKKMLSGTKTGGMLKRVI